jgi:ABC-type transport system involved in cytochrome bd biosynthesis fused ATPase/permease subunit
MPCSSEIQGLADLLAFDQANEHRARVLRLNAELNRVQERQAMLRGVSNALVVLFTSLAALTILWLAIPLVWRLTRAVSAVAAHGHRQFGGGPCRWPYGSWKPVNLLALCLH